MGSCDNTLSRAALHIHEWEKPIIAASQLYLTNYRLAVGLGGTLKTHQLISDDEQTKHHEYHLKGFFCKHLTAY